MSPLYAVKTHLICSFMCSCLKFKTVLLSQSAKKATVTYMTALKLLCQGQKHFLGDQMLEFRFISKEATLMHKTMV